VFSTSLAFRYLFHENRKGKNVWTSFLCALGGDVEFFFLTYASQPEKASQCNERRCLGADHVAETALFVSPLCICCFPAKNLHVREQQYVQH
jgi:hypothetical protein